MSQLEIDKIMEVERYTCKRGHKWRCGWIKGKPRDERWDCCEDCMGYDSASYLPEDLVEKGQTQK